MNQLRPLTVCVLSDDTAPDAFLQCPRMGLAQMPKRNMELRLSFHGAIQEFHECLGTLCPDGAFSRYQKLPHNIDRFTWTGANEQPITAWVSTAKLPKDLLRRHLFHDVPLRTDYVACVAADASLEAGWWDALAPLLDDGADYVGQPAWHPYSQPQMDMIQTQPWFMGVPFDRREGRPGVSYMKPGLVVMRSEGVRQANFPDARPSGVCDSDILLGEIARQLGWKQGVLGNGSQTQPAQNHKDG